MFRDRDLPESFTSPLEASGWQIHCVPVLSFDFASHSAGVAAALHIPYDFYVFPSKRAVDGVAAAGVTLSFEATWIAVGQATAFHAESTLGKLPDLIGSQGAREVIAQALERFDLAGKTVAYICGDLQATLPEDLLATCCLEQVCAYSTVPASADEIRRGFEAAGEPHTLVFFSPSGVRAVVGALGENYAWADTRLIAIGKTTAKALTEELGRCDGVPEQSNLDGIRDLLLTL